MVATSKKIALINRNKELSKKLEGDAKELINNLIDEILHNIVAFDLPKVLREKYPGLTKQEVVERLKELNYCDILRHLEWIPKKIELRKTDDEPRTCLNDPTVDDQPRCQAISS